MTSTRVCQALHEEHRATIGLVERIAGLLNRHRRSLPDSGDAATVRLLNEIPEAMDAGIARHFDFEEGQLFPYLAAAGDVAIGAHLTDEHEVMRQLGRALADLARTGAAGGLDEAGWQAFRRVGEELCNRMLEHVQKEEMVLLPLLEENLDSEADARLYDAYAGDD
jgi:hemerythrin-like domain-containing protein